MTNGSRLGTDLNILVLVIINGFGLARSFPIVSWLLKAYGSTTPNFEIMNLLYSFAVGN